jgi:hypothetical protein
VLVDPRDVSAFIIVVDHYIARITRFDFTHCVMSLMRRTHGAGRMAAFDAALAQSCADLPVFRATKRRCGGRRRKALTDVHICGKKRRRACAPWHRGVAKPLLPFASFG